MNKWEIILASGQHVEMTGDNIKVEYGALIVYELGGIVKHVFAPGTWIGGSLLKKEGQVMKGNENM